MLQYLTECNAFQTGISMQLQPNMWQQLTGMPGSFALRTVAPNIMAGNLDAVGLGISAANAYGSMDILPVGKREQVTGIGTALNDSRLNGHFNKHNTANYPRPGGGPPARIQMGSSPGAGGGLAAS